MEKTADPDIVIESRGNDWIRYRRSDGRRWEVHGICDRRGDCLVGAIVDGKVISRADVDSLRETDIRLQSQLDVPVTPEFNTCCGSDLFTYIDLGGGE
jgi:hypothetical protein